MLDLNVREDSGNEVLVVNFDSEISQPVAIARLACSRLSVQWGRSKKEDRRERKNWNRLLRAR